MRQFYADAAWLQQLVTEELRPRPGRIRTSVRWAIISAVGAALMLTGLGLIPLITSVVVSILVSQRSREAREQELHHLNLILERLDGLERKLEGFEP